MKVVIFAGGLGTRISEETEAKPKPMVEIGGKPILWHIMKIYEKYGHDEFVVCLGYKGYAIKEFFFNYYMHQSDVTIDLASNSYQFHNSSSESFKITLVETGLNTKTAGRLKLVEKYVQDEDFMLTYGDGVSDVDINKLIEFHKTNNKIATVTAVQLEARFGGMELSDNGEVLSFREKAKDEGKWINAGFFVLKPEIFKYFQQDMSDIMWEDAPLEQLTGDNQLVAYRHIGFWKCMDALRDKIELESMWQSNQGKMENLVTVKDLSTVFKHKRVLITGHSGFKGIWLTAILHKIGAVFKRIFITT